LEDKQLFPDALPVPPMPGLARVFGMLLFFIFPLMDIGIRVTLVRLQIELR
jgi:hypothetical protein